MRTLEQLLEARRIFEAVFEGFLALLRVGGGGVTIEPRLLLLGVQELAQSFHANSRRGYGQVWTARLIAEKLSAVPDHQTVMPGSGHSG